MTFQTRAACCLALGFVSACTDSPRPTPTQPSLQPTPLQRVLTVQESTSGAVTRWGCLTETRNPGWGQQVGCHRPLREASVVASATAPGRPGALTATVSGAAVTLAWGAGCCDPTSYRIEAGSASGLSDVASFDTGSAAVSLVVTDVPTESILSGSGA